MHTLAASQGVHASEAAVCQPSRVVASSVSDATRCGAAAATLHATKPARSASQTQKKAHITREFDHDGTQNCM